MKRRKFIQDSSLLALSVGVFGKIKWDGEKYTGTDPTTTDILGPFDLLYCHIPGRTVRLFFIPQHLLISHQMLNKPCYGVTFFAYNAAFYKTQRSLSVN